MSERSATVYIDYQQRASEFSVGDAVVPFGTDSMASGRVVSVFPAIGMVDVEFAYGNKRYPVEDLQRIRQDSPVNEPKAHDSVPGGAGSVEVSGGPDPSANHPDPPIPAFMVDDDEENKEREERRTARIEAHLSQRVAKAYVKKALYWGAVDRKYRATKAEISGGNVGCPKCNEGALRNAIYKRDGGVSEKLMGCPVCMFLIKRCDILGLGG